MKYYPLFVDLRGQRCVVLGSGHLAAEKVESLRRAGAEVDWIRTGYRPGALAGARLVFDATGDPATGKAAWEEAEAAGIMINVVDVPSRCRFIMPAVVDRDPLLIAISTSGESPFLASALRARLERSFGPEWGVFVGLVGEIRRRLRRSQVPLSEQTPIYRRLLRSPVRRLIRQGRAEKARCIAEEIASSRKPCPGRVALVGAGPGSVDLLTLAARDLLAEADVVFHDALVHPDVLALCGPSAELVDVGKRGERGGVDQTEIVAMMIARARQGLEIVRLKGGDPFVFGRGGEEVLALAAAGIDVTVVPGLSSALAAPAAAGVPVTHRGLARSFAVVTATATGESTSQLVAAAAAVDTLVVMMGCSRLREIAEALTPIRGAETGCAVVASATWAEQKIVRAPLGKIAEAAAKAEVEAPATLVVGASVDALPVAVAARLAALSAV